MMQTIKLGMFSPHLHPPSKTKILIVLIQELTAVFKFQVGGKGGEKKEGKKKKISILSSTIQTKRNAKN